MRPAPCFNLQERMLPHLRAETARRLSGQGLRQSRIAAHLGVSQAMVSKYLRASPPPPEGVATSLLRALVDRAVAAVASEEERGRLPAWCPLCPQLLGPATGGEGIDACLRGERPLAADEGAAVLENLRAAADRLRAPGIARLAPEVSVNVAMAVADAHDARGVAAFPGRLAEVRGELVPVAPPEFGASNHLAETLLRVRKSHPEIRAVACLRDDADVRRAIKDAGFQSRTLRRQRGELVVHAPGAPDALVDPGAFGIEPITYLFGATAVDVAEKAERIRRALPARGR